MKIVAVKELMWTYHPIPKDWPVISIQNKAELDTADVLVQTNIKGGKKERKLGHIYQYVLDSNKPFICLESAVFRRNMPDPPHVNAYHRWNWSSYFRDEGIYNNKNCPPDRWKQIQKTQRIDIKDWKTKGDYVLLVLQRPGDTSLKNLISIHGSYENFITFTVNEIRKYTDRKIVVRPHPSRRLWQLEIIKKCNLKDVIISENKSREGMLSGGDQLYADFKNAWAVVGFNSNALTESVCEGIPTFSMCPSSMAWECSNKTLKLIEQPKMFDRQQWLNNLGYCQWTEKECFDGVPWQHLKKVIHEV